jgi:hypothetical protein
MELVAKDGKTHYRVSLRRAKIEVIADIHRMFKHFSEVKNKAQAHHDESLGLTMDSVIEQWTQV